MNRGDFVRKEDRKVEGMGETERRFPKEDSMPGGKMFDIHRVSQPRRLGIRLGRSSQSRVRFNDLDRERGGLSWA
jgi:hypothetical protein